MLLGNLEVVGYESKQLSTNLGSIYLVLLYAFAVLIAITLLLSCSSIAKVARHR